MTQIHVLKFINRLFKKTLENITQKRMNLKFRNWLILKIFDKTKDIV